MNDRMKWWKTPPTPEEQEKRTKRVIKFLLDEKDWRTYCKRNGLSS